MARTATRPKPKAVRITSAQVQAHRKSTKKDASPTWDGCDSWSAEKFRQHWHFAMQFYNLEFHPKDLKPAVIKWMTQNGYDAATIKAFSRTKDWRCGSTMGAIASCLLRGMTPQRDDWNNGSSVADWLKNQIAKAIEDGQSDIEVEAPSSVPTPTIQERVRETAINMTEEIEDAYESFIKDAENFDPKSLNVYNTLKAKGAKAAHARIIKEKYAPELEELLELASGKADEQLREGYQHRSKKQIRALIEFLKGVESACNMLTEVAKVERKPRAKKAVSKDKVVSKLKFKTSDETLKLVSIPPTEIIGAQTLWIYDTKKRKIGKYVAAEHCHLNVKGTSLIGFDEKLSVQKTLRKPAEQLKAFKDAGKVALRKFLEDINAVDIKLNGRLNADIILLKAVL